MIYVSHRLREILAIADEVTVMRDGRRAFNGPARGLSEADLMKRMVGDAGAGPDYRAATARDRSKTIIRIDGIRSGALAPTCLTINAGEIVGCVGLRGAGQESDRPGARGDRTLYRHGRASGEALSPGSRRRCVPARRRLHQRQSRRQQRSHHVGAGKSVHQSALHAVAALVSLEPRRARRHRTGEKIAYGVHLRAPAQAMGEQSSGGNAQKVVLARGLESSPSLVILEDPTAGVDMPTRFALYDVMRARAADGIAFLITSSRTMTRSRAICDRIHVFRGGRIAATLEGTTVRPGEDPRPWPRGKPHERTHRHRPRAARTEKRRPRLRRRGALGSYGLVIVVLIVIGIFAALKPDTFLTASTLLSIATSQSITALLALAIVGVLIVGEDFDLSLHDRGERHRPGSGDRSDDRQPPRLAARLPSRLGGRGHASGVANAFMDGAVAHQFLCVTTLGVSTILSELRRRLFRRHDPDRNPVGHLLGLGAGRHRSGSRCQFGICSLVASALYILLEFTSTGRHMRAVGGNRAAAQLAGISVGRAVTVAFVISGLVSGFAAIISVGQLGSGQAVIASGYLLPAYAGAIPRRDDDHARPL